MDGAPDSLQRAGRFLRFTTEETEAHGTWLPLLARDRRGGMDAHVGVAVFEACPRHEAARPGPPLSPVGWATAWHAGAQQVRVGCRLSACRVLPVTAPLLCLLGAGCLALIVSAPQRPSLCVCPQRPLQTGGFQKAGRLCSLPPARSSSLLGPGSTLQKGCSAHPSTGYPLYFSFLKDSDVTCALGQATLLHWGGTWEAAIPWPALPRTSIAPAWTTAAAFVVPRGALDSGGARLVTSGAPWT